MYKYLKIDDFIQFDIHNNNESKLIITDNKLKNNCNIYIYEIKKKDKLYYLYYIVYKFTYDKENILIHYYLNNIERNTINESNYECIGSYKTLSYLLEYLNNQCVKIHKYHYLIQNSNIYKNSKMYYILHMEKLLKNNT